VSAALWLEVVAPLLAFSLRADPAPGESGRDTALARRAGEGDRQAFDELYRRHADSVYRRLGRLVGPDPDREDLVQQVFLDALRGLPGFRGEAAFSTWLYRIVVNVAQEHLRKRYRRSVISVESFDLDSLLDAEPTPEAKVRRRQELVMAFTLLDRIKPKKRVAFVLRTVEGLSLDEIASIVGATAPAVGQRVKHAQRELAALWAKRAGRME
jgi:RNA polymerase sigma-70 factor (ECF subfamily)